MIRTRLTRSIRKEASTKNKEEAASREALEDKDSKEDIIMLIT